MLNVRAATAKGANGVDAQQTVDLVHYVFELEVGVNRRQLQLR